MFDLGVAGDFSFPIKHQNKMPVRCAALLSCAGLREEVIQSIITSGEELSGQGIISVPPGSCETSRQDNSPPLPLTVTVKMLLSQHPWPQCAVGLLVRGLSYALVHSPDPKAVP